MINLLKFVTVVLALLSGFFAQDILNGFRTYFESRALHDQYCMLSTTACVQDDVSMTLSADNAQALVPVQISVTWPNHQAESLTLTMEGHEMDMGVVKFNLTPQSSGLYQGEVMLPVCTIDEMTWVGELTDGTLTVNPAMRMQR